jgi:hypothetical protein
MHFYGVVVCSTGDWCVQQLCDKCVLLVLSPLYGVWLFSPLGLPPPIELRAATECVHPRGVGVAPRS